MFRALALAAALLSTSPALADGNPPPIPDRYKGVYTGKLTSHSVAFGGAWGACNDVAKQLGRPTFPIFAKWNAKAGRPLLGCAFGGKGEGANWCVVVWTKGKEHVRKHEIAHCQGWPADHPVE